MSWVHKNVYVNLKNKIKYTLLYMHIYSFTYELIVSFYKIQMLSLSIDHILLFYSIEIVQKIFSLKKQVGIVK